jgi:hypothetical protein
MVLELRWRSIHQLGVPMAPKKSHKPIHESIVEEPTQDLDVPFETIKEEEQDDYEEQENHENRNDQENEKE